MSPREERAIRNEELFREVNLNIANLEQLAAREPLPLVCECALTGCSVPIEATPAHQAGSSRTTLVSYRPRPRTARDRVSDRTTRGLPDRPKAGPVRVSD